MPIEFSAVTSRGAFQNGAHGETESRNEGSGIGSEDV